MAYSVPALSISFMSISALTGFALPVALLFYLKNKLKTGIKPFFIGCATFIVFALILEQFFHLVILNSGIGKTIKTNTWLFSIYGGLMAGLFEETGRLAAFKTVLKKDLKNDRNALMYGAGHGGVEAFFILVLGMASNIITSIMLNTGAIEQLTAGITDEAQLQELNKTFELLSNSPPVNFLIGIFERIAAVAIHISLSVLVWFAVKKKGKCFWLYPLAILLHAFVDAVAVILSRNVPNVWVVELVIYLITVCIILIAVQVWKKHGINYNLEDSVDPVETV
ncbi:MAG: YhfC family intramembrane metalloprotease [Clostridiaceae bacterium]|nr:YhfC family intramembrane metalloprotease [Clostridiaceae bacterium]